MTYQPEYAPEFLKERHPELFVNFDHLENTSLEERQRLETAFYNHALTYNDIKINPKLADMLKDKNLFLAYLLLQNI